jgi:hypothetical protein
MDTEGNKAWSTTRTRLSLTKIAATMEKCQSEIALPCNDPTLGSVLWDSGSAGETKCVHERTEDGGAGAVGEKPPKLCMLQHLDMPQRRRRRRRAWLHAPLEPRIPSSACR